MKNVRITPAIIIFFASLLIFISCVSKKKYLEMQEDKVNAEEHVAVLTGDVDLLSMTLDELKREFDLIKNNIHISNAKKDAYIDSINAKMSGMSVDAEHKESEVTDMIYAFESEVRQLKSAVAQKDRQIGDLKVRVEDQKKEIAEIKQNIADLKFSKMTQTDDILAKDREIELKNKELVKNEEEVAKHLSEISKLKRQMGIKDEEIEKLSNQVQLLKKELGM